jgi:hypothetical protein
MRIRDLFDPGSGMEKFVSGFWYKHPGSATSVPATTICVSSFISQPLKLKLKEQYLYEENPLG